MDIECIFCRSIIPSDNSSQHSDKIPPEGNFSGIDSVDTTEGKVANNASDNSFDIFMSKKIAEYQVSKFEILIIPKIKFLTFLDHHTCSIVDQ